MLSDSAAARLAKLLPRLATDRQGEILATAGAIGRTLADAGADLHDLASAPTGSPVISGEIRQDGPHLRARIRELATALAKTTEELDRLRADASAR